LKTPSILLAYGTRPEYIKIRPLAEKMNGVLPYKVLFTGQHDHLVSGVGDFSLRIEEDGHRLDAVVRAAMKLPDEVFEGIGSVLVQGDTASAFALALAAFHRGLPVIHLEAGLRTYDLENPYPEELYRQCVSRIARVHLCPTENNRDNLLNERCGGSMHVVGNSVLDNLRDVETSYGNEVLVTLHRRENHPLIPRWFRTISDLARRHPELTFTFPVHPNPHVQKHKQLLAHVNAVAPLDYLEMIRRIGACRFLISDSGGIQEEASFLQKRVIVCRRVTERPESLGTHSLLCPSPEELPDRFEEVRSRYRVQAPCPYGDGRSSERIVKVLQEELAHGHGGAVRL